MRRRKTAAELEAQCRAFNEGVPVGSPVRYHPIIGGRGSEPTKTKSEAYVLSGHTAVIFVAARAGCVALDAIAQQPPEGEGR